METVNPTVSGKNHEELAKDQGLFTSIDLKHDLPTEWHKATTLATEEGGMLLI